MLPALHQNILTDILRNKRFTALAAIYFVGISLIFTQITHALFTDSASSNNNTFTAAAVFPTGSLTPTPTTSITPTPPEAIANHLVISEVQITEGTGASDHDFIEIYNPTNSAISLDGMRLVKRTSSGVSDTNIKSFSSSDNVQPHGFYLWASSSDATFSASLNPNSSTVQTISSDNSIALRNGPEDSGTIIDGVGWGTLSGTPLIEGVAFSQNPASGQSIERKALSTSDTSSMSSGVDINKGNGYDAGDNSSDFILRTISQPQNSSSLAESI